MQAEKRQGRRKVYLNFWNNRSIGDCQIIHGTDYEDDDDDEDEWKVERPVPTL
jgi:hypothetical protein